MPDAGSQEMPRAPDASSVLSHSASCPYAEATAASTQAGIVGQIGDQPQRGSGRFATSSEVALRRSRTSAWSQTSADAVDDTHPLVGGQRQAASPAASLHEAQGARDGVNRAGASPSCCRTCVADDIALLLADMETIRAGASPSPKDRNLKLEFVEPGSEAVSLRQGAEGASSCRCI